YAAAIERAGGQPVVIPPFVEADEASMRGQARLVVSRVDALVMLGGADIDPARYGAARHPETAGGDVRPDPFEMAPLEAAVAEDTADHDVHQSRLFDAVVAQARRRLRHDS